MTGQMLDPAFDDPANDAAIRRSAELALLQALEELHEGENARRASRIALERAEDQVMRGIAVALREDIEHALVTTRAKLHAMREQTADENQAKSISRMEDTLTRAMTRLQRLVLEVRPPGLESNGLAATLRAYLESVKAAYRLDYEITNELHREPDLDVQVTLFRIAQEAVDNTRKYAGASKVELAVRDYAGGILLRVSDDGAGFDPESLEAERIGLISMRERAEVREGWCQVNAASGKGTTVEAWIPAATKKADGAGDSLDILDAASGGQIV